MMMSIDKIRKQVDDDLFERIELYQTNPQFQKAVSENPAILVAGLNFEQASLLVELTKFLGVFGQRKSGGGVSFDPPPWHWPG